MTLRGGPQADGAVDDSFRSGAGEKVYYNGFVGRKGQKYDKGRTSFIPEIASPGPAAYAPSTDPIKTSAPHAPFGTAHRDNESARFISELHNKSLPALGNPGPGTYRVASGPFKNNPTHSKTPSWKFGTAEQHTDYGRTSPTKSFPGPIYNQELPPLGPSVTFAPMGSLELGMQRSRYDDRCLFLSADHSRRERGVIAKDYVNVGPGLYDTQKAELSTSQRLPRAVFGKSSNNIMCSLTETALSHQPLSTSAVDTPGAIYDLGSTLSTQTTAFGKAPQVYAPEKGNSTAGPYLSRGHENAMKGHGPGPGMYDIQGGRGKAVGGLGDGPMYPFGVLPNSGEPHSMARVKVPGPGAYNAREDRQSTIPTAAAFSMAANLRTDWTDMNAKDVPGPGTYDVDSASKVDGSAKRPPSFSMGAQDKSGRASFIKPSITPGPGYTLPDEISPKKGYSFGSRDKTRNNKTTIGVRYLGPLAAQETLGTEGPGPVYDTTQAIGGGPAMKMGTSGRDVGSKIFISQQHAEAEGMGADSPGPGAYDASAKELAVVTSKFKKPAAAVFSTTQRFASNYSTF